MIRPSISLLVDARAGTPVRLPSAPDVEVVVAGPGQPVELPAEASEAAVFHHLVAASSAPLCVWLRAGDVPHPKRIALLRRVQMQLQAPVVAHLPPGASQDGAGTIGRLPGPVVTRGLAVHPDTIAFRRDVAQFAPLERDFRYGTRRALLNWAALRGSVGWIDLALLTRPPAPPPTPADLLEIRARQTSGSYAALRILHDLKAPANLVNPATEHLLACSQTWTWNHWDFLVAHKRPRWVPSSEDHG